MSRYFNFLASIYISTYKKPFLKHFYLNKLTLPIYAQKIIFEHNEYYQKLSIKDRLNFNHRVASVINSKKFIGLENLKVADEMRLIIAAVMVKLTFG